MKYNQPYGISDPNAPYLNGNPSTGQMGSIPPAWSIEHDQREIVAVIQYAADNGLLDYNSEVCHNPSEADLTQLLKAIFGLSNRQRVVVPFTLYVNDATGNDLNTGLIGAPFKTIQKAVEVASQYAPGPNTITIKCAPGNYAGFTLPNYSIPPIWLEGDTTTPSAVVINGGVGAATPQWAVGCGSYNTLDISYCKLQAQGGFHIGPGSSGIAAFTYATIRIRAGVTFGQCDLALLFSMGNIIVYNPFHVNGSVCDYVLCALGGEITCGYYNQGLELFFDTALACDAFAAANGTGSQIGSWGVTFNGRSGVTGTRYASDWGAHIDTNVGGATYFPGDSAGYATNGGTYR